MALKLNLVLSDEDIQALAERIAAAITTETGTSASPPPKGKKAKPAPEPEEDDEEEDDEAEDEEVEEEAEESEHVFGFDPATATKADMQPVFDDLEIKMPKVADARQVLTILEAAINGDLTEEWCTENGVKSASLRNAIKLLGATPRKSLADQCESLTEFAAENFADEEAEDEEDDEGEEEEDAEESEEEDDADEEEEDDEEDDEEGDDDDEEDEVLDFDTALQFVRDNDDPDGAEDLAEVMEDFAESLDGYEGDANDLKTGGYDKGLKKLKTALKKKDYEEAYLIYMAFFVGTDADGEPVQYEDDEPYLKGSFGWCNGAPLIEGEDETGVDHLSGTVYTVSENGELVEA